MKIKKIISAFISSFLFTSAYAQNSPSLNTNEFIETYDTYLQKMLASYHESVKEPLDGKIFDISNPLYKSFLQNSTKRHYDNEFLAMQFYQNFRVNDKATHFCFVLFDSSKTRPFNSYMNFMFPNSESATFYLVAHEFGHCVTLHQQTIKKIPTDTDARELEKIADMFAISFFLVRKEEKNALSIIENMKKLPKEDIHSNSSELENFYNYFSKNMPNVKNTSELFDAIYVGYKNIKK